jgi:hypothetical protein
MNTPFNFSLGLAQERKCSGNASDAARRNTTSLNWSDGSDMSIFSFTLTLLLLGTVGATQTENPMFWLLIGPAPFSVVFIGLVFFRQRFGLRRRRLSPLEVSRQVSRCAPGKASVRPFHFRQTQAAKLI